jgi:secernin
MCDTFVALGNVTKDDSAIFGKNSDRKPNEIHEVLLIPHAAHLKDAVVECTYIDIS